MTPLTNMLISSAVNPIKTGKAKKNIFFNSGVINLNSQICLYMPILEIYCNAALKIVAIIDDQTRATTPYDWENKKMPSNIIRDENNVGVCAMANFPFAFCKDENNKIVAVNGNESTIIRENLIVKANFSPEKPGAAIFVIKGEIKKPVSDRKVAQINKSAHKLETKRSA